MTTEKSFVIRLGVKDADAAAAALRAFGAEGAAALRKIEDAARKAKGAASAQREYADSVGATRQQLQQLQPQLNDIFTQLASGQSVFTVLVQQGPQITQIFGGLRQTFAAIPASIKAVALPLAAVGAAFALYERHASSVREFDRTVKLMGGTLGQTASQMSALAEASAEAGRVSVAAARAMANEYAKVAKVGPETMSRLVTITKDYATLTGQDAAEATKELAGLLKDPAKGADELASRFNLLSGVMLDHIRRLTESGRAAEAQRVLVEALGQRVKGAAEETSIWARAWDAVARGASNAADAVGKAINRAVNGPSLEERIAAAEEVLRARRKDQRRFGGVLSTKAAENAEAELVALREEQRERSRFAATQGIAAANNAASRAAVDLATKYDGLGTTIRGTESELAKLRRGLGPGMGDAAKSGEQAVERLQNRLDDLRKVPAGLDLETYKRQQQADLEKRYAGRFDAASQREKAAEAERISLLGTATTTAERNAQAEAARTGVIASQTAAVAQSAAQTDLATRGASALAQAWQTSAAATIEAEARQQALNEAMTQAVDVQARTRQLVAERAAQEAAALSQSVAVMEQDVAAQRRIAEAAAQGTAARLEAERQAQVAKATSTALAAAQAAEAQGAVELAKQLRDLAARYDDLSKAGSDAAKLDTLNRLVETQDAARRRLGQRATLIGAPEDVRAVAEAQAEIVEGLRAQGIEYEKLSEAEKARYDLAVRTAGENAKRTEDIKRQESAWATLTGSLEKAFDRLGDSLVDVFVSGKGEAVNFGNVVKGILSSIAADLLKMAVAAPLKNVLFGTNSPTLFDLPIFGGTGGSGGAVAGAPAGGSSLMGNMSNWAVNKAGTWLLDKVWTGSYGESLWNSAASWLGLGGSGAAAVTGGMGAGGSYLAGQTVNGFIVGGEAGGIAASGGAGAASGSGAGAAGGGAGLGAMGGVGLGSAGLGYAWGGYWGTKANSKAVGALHGAGAGALYGTMMLPGIGTVIGAVVGAIAGMLGTQKKATQYGGAWVRFDDKGEVIDRGQGAENGVDDNALRQRVDNIKTLLDAFTGSTGLTRPKELWIGTEYHEEKGHVTVLNGWEKGRVEVSKSEDPQQIAVDVLKHLEKAGSLSGNADVLTAIRNSKSTTAEEFAKDLDVAKSFRPWFDAMKTGGDAVASQVREMFKEAEELGKQAKEQVVEFRDRIVALGIATKEELTPALRNSVEAMLGLGKDAEALHGLAAVTKQVELNFASFKPVLTELGYTAAEQADLLTRVTRNAVEEYDRQVADVVRRGNNLINQAANSNFTLTGSDVLSNLGYDPAKFPKFVEGLDAFLSKAEAGRATLADLTAAQAEINQRLRNGRISAEDYGQILQYLVEVYSRGADTLAQAAQQAEQSIAQTWAQVLQNARQTAQALVDTFKAAGESLASARASLLVDKNLSPLTGEARRTEAMRQLFEAANAAKGSDAAAAAKAMEKLPALSQAALEASRDYYVSSAQYFADFETVSGILASTESVAERQARLAAETVIKLDRLIGTTSDGLSDLEAALRDTLAKGDFRDYGSGGRGAVNRLIAAALPGYSGGFAAGEFEAWARTKVPAGASLGSNPDLNAMLVALGANPVFGDGKGTWGIPFHNMAADDPRRIAARELARLYGFTPAFADGGLHTGGLRLVGERGPELEVTGPARYFSAEQTVGMLRAANDPHGGNVVPLPRASGDPETRALLREIRDRLDAVIRISAAAGDGTHRGLSDVADATRGVLRATTEAAARR